ncbi:MAG: N-acetylmuramoyl-L-alanine amidase family protein [Gemmatimonadota bacterium]
MRAYTLTLAAALGASLVALEPLPAQTPAPTLHVEGLGEPASVAVATHRGYPAYPAWTLRSLGARVDATPRGGVVVFGADTLRFDAGSPFFHAAGQAWQLVEAPYREGGVFYLPHQLFAEWLPERYPDQLAYDGGHLRLLGAGSTEGAAGPTRPAGAPGDSPAGSDPAPPLGTPDDSRPVIVIDAGHGGRDPGAVGPSGVKEKDIVLQVSKRLAKVLAERGYDIRMTRTTDTLIALGDRPHMANEWRGNRPGLFLSIHANYVSDRRVRGFETFFLSDARTDDERRVAEMENAAVAFESPEDRVVPTDHLALIRSGLRNESYIRASYDLAGLIQDEVGAFHRGRNRGVKQAGFIVLIGAVMPAVLVELAFISNPEEERLLASGSFQVDVAEGIADAVDRFFDGSGGRWIGASP